MRDWMAEALAFSAPPPPKNMEGYTDKKDIEDKKESFGTSVPFVRPPLHLDDAWETAEERGGDVALPAPEPEAISTPFAPGELGDWQRHLSRLRTDEAPCPGFRHWPSVQRVALQFLHDRGDEAVRLGWGVLDLFGVHATAGAIRVDCTGALITLRGKHVAELTPALIRIADGLAYRRRPMSAGQSIPVWNFGGSSC